MSRKFSEVYQVKSPARTEGDGMESTEEAPSNEVTSVIEAPKNLRDQFIYHPVDLNQPITKNELTFPRDIVNLTPKNVTKITRGGKKKTNLNFGKEPKFVPYEPYKAAVKPIIPFEKEKSRKKHLIPVHASKKSIDNTSKLNDEFNKMKVSQTEEKVPDTKSENKVDSEDWTQEKKLMELELKQLKEENSALENQVKFQTQVNGELKKLLVAAVGEDIEARVHLLTEDKLQLARALLSSAQHLSTHQEQIEWLAGQCEVWRSKFLASSLMVEELAKWKASLNQKVSTYEDVIRQLRFERNSVRKSSYQTFRNLHVLQTNYDLAAMVNANSGNCLPKSSNILDLAAANHATSENLKLQLLGADAHKYKGINLDGLNSETPAEQLCIQAMSVPVELLERTDDACSAVIEAAVALNATVHNPNCHHCTGKVQVV